MAVSPTQPGKRHHVLTTTGLLSLAGRPPSLERQAFATTSPDRGMARDIIMANTQTLSG